MSSSKVPTSQKLTSDHIKALMATFWTWTFDLYDLFIMSLIAPYIAELFFTHMPYTVALAATMASYFTSFIMRPLGAITFSPLGDKIGRKKVITYGVIGLAIFETSQAALPTAAQVGILAPALLITLRLGLGYFVGSIVGGSHLIGPESVPERHRGWVGGFGFSAAGMAYLLAAAWFLLSVYVAPGPLYLAYGWRIMFLGGLLPLIILFYVNYIVPESPIYSALKRRGEVTKTPVRDFFSRRSGLLKLFIIALLVTISWGGLYYATIGLYPTFLAVVNKLPKAEIGYIMLLSSVAMLTGPTLGGEISQHIGRKLMSIIGSVIVIAISFLYLHLGMLPPSAFDLILAEAVIISLLSDFGGGILMTYLNEVYPGHVRSTGVSFTWNTGFATGAAITIVGIPALVAMYGIKAFPSIEVEIIILLAVIGLIAMIFSPETRGNIERERQALGA